MTYPRLSFDRAQDDTSCLAQGDTRILYTLPMSLYSYTALNAQKERLQGMVDAISLQAARSALQDTGLFVEEIHEATPTERESTKPWETEAVVEDTVGMVGQGGEVGNVSTVSNVGAEGVERETSNEPTSQQSTYYPLLDTLRLYAGWLLAWYVLVIALGAYQETKNLPFHIPLVEGLWQSVLIIRAAFGVFLFLILTSLYRFFGNRTWLGLILGVFGMLLFYVFFVNT